MKTMLKNLVGIGALGVGVMFAGCGKTEDKPKVKDAAVGRDDHSGHSHGDRAIAEAGKYHAVLEAHADEGELEIAFETQDKTPSPAALPLTGITAQAKLDGGEFKEVKFEPADAKERPADKPGACSRFSAKLAGLKEAKKVFVAAKVQIDGKDETLEWRDFAPGKHEHKH